MKGLELARGLWEEYGRPTMEHLPGMEQAAVGLCGAGSDCLGYDDDTSHDHDWGPGFMVYLPEAAERQYGFALSKAYDSLPAEYKSYKVVRRSRMGDARWGVKTVEGYFRPFTGKRGMRSGMGRPSILAGPGRWMAFCTVRPRNMERYDTLDQP